MNRFAWFLLGALLLLAPTGRPLAADEAQKPGAPINSDPKVPFERYTLPNGIEVILHQDNRIPLVAVDLWYHVGSGDEVLGKSGFAHLFEHMLFQGSLHVGEDKHFDILKRIGATDINGSTNTDRTNYYEVVPSHFLETALWLESDRMGYLLPKLTDPSLANQKEVVRNERRQRYENVPYGAALFEASKLLYPEGHPYRYKTIGRHEDLATARLEDVTAFYKKWYLPANATVCVAGDFEIANAKRLIEKWFATLPRTARPAHTARPLPVAEHHRSELKDPFAKLRRIDYAWSTPAFFAPGDAELDILADALAAPGTGRLYRVLVHQKQLAQSVVAYQASQQLSSYFQVSVTAKSGADLAEIERVMNEEIERVRREVITQREFDRSVVNKESDYVWGLEGLLERAEALQRYNHYVGTPDFISGDLDRYRKSSPQKVQEIAARFLDPKHRVEVLTNPAGGK